MNPNYLPTDDKGWLLSKVWKESFSFQGFFVRHVFQILLLICVILPSVNIEAAPVITNTATANYTVNGNNLNLSDSVQFTKDTVVAPTDFIELEKQANETSAEIGENITYTLTVTNPNPRLLTNVSIQDVLPQGFIYQAGTARLNNVVIPASEVAVSGNNLSISLGDMPADTSSNITYVVDISDSTSTGNNNNRATATSDTATSTQAQASVTITDPIVVLPSTPLVLTKTANTNDVKVGETVSYTLTIKNNNAHIITGAVVNDTLPAGLEYIPGSASFNGNSITANVSDELSFDIGDLTANSDSELSYNVTVVNNENTSRILVNNANVAASDTNANSNNSSAIVNVVDDVILLSKSTSTISTTAGETVDYSITLTNTLDRELTNVVIKDILPQGFNYQLDTAQNNNVALLTDDVSVAGNIVNFQLGSLAASESTVLSYKVIVNENAIPGDNVNIAQAMTDFASSEAATASVKVRTPSIINFLKVSDTGVNSIIQPTSYNTNQQGGKNFEEINNITLADGTNINLPSPQPIVDANQYTAGDPIVIEVIDLDQNLDSNVLETIEVTVQVPGTNDTEILLLTETTPSSGVFRGIVLTTTDATSVQDGVLSIADGVTINVNYRDNEDNTDTSATAALVVPDTQLQIEKTVDKDYSAVGELVRYTLEFRNTTGFNLTNLEVHDLLPIGFRYIPNTAELNGNLITNNVSFDGRSLSFQLTNMPAGSVWNIQYVTKVSAGTKIGDAVNTAYFTSDSLRSNDAQATVKIKDDLMRDKNILTGRVYIGCKTKSDEDEIAPEVLGEARIFMETGRSVLTDREGFWHMEGVYPGAHVVQLDTESIPGYEPMLCNDNTRRAKEAISHFVDLQPGTLWHVDFHVKPIEGYVKEEAAVKKTKKSVTDPLKLFNKDYIDTASEGFEILWPKNNYVPAVASTKIFIKSSPQQKVEVFLNGNKVSPLNYDGSDTNKERTVTIKRWFGVDIDIKKKNNTLLAILKDKSGKEIARKSHNIHFSSRPASAKLLADESVLIADGKTTPVITLRVKDEDGFPMRANTHGYFTIENNKYSIKTQNTYDADVRDLNESLSGTYKYEIEENGIARIQLNPTTQSGQVKLNLQFTDSKSINKNVEINAWLKPALREWIMVGIAEGTLAYKRLSGNMQTLKRFRSFG